MRILQISSARAFGGGERHFADLARGLASRGHEVFAALAPDSPLAEKLNELPTGNIHTLPLRNALDIKSALRLARLAREREVDVIHAHVARDYTLAAFAARRCPRARLVITRHVLFPLGRAHRLALRDVARVIAVSGAVESALLARRIFPADKIRVVHNGVDVRRFAPARLAGPRGGPLRVGIVGELSPVKGQEDFVRAAALISKEFAGEVEFVVVGEDATRTGERRARVESLVSELGLKGRVRMEGHRDDVSQILPTFDVFVSASRSEAFGVAMVEAMAAGVPVVATATEGALEIIEEGVTGLTVPPGDVASLASAVRSLLEDARLRASLAAEGARAARERFSIERMVEETERVYAERP
ncbi:MAG TPA: glycosyltransferase family 4 protein [Pyrinomonadaceae bacterium]|nr:glycosyltransferase family 4 protein [Pyrinomonadaceae bacterium]